MPKTYPLSIRISQLERSLGRVHGLLAKALPSITHGEFEGNAVTDTVRHQRTEQCEVDVEITVAYDVESYRETENDDGEVVDTCVTYDITTTVEVTETCRTDEGVKTTGKGTATHVSRKEFCDAAGDITMADTGRTTGFDGKLTETLSYPHGVKVNVETKDGGSDDGKTTVRVTFPDGTGSSVTVD